jgi:ribonuclease HI
VIIDYPPDYYRGDNARKLLGESLSRRERNLLPLAAMNDYSSIVAIAHTDGGSRGNPGDYGCAAVLYVDGTGYQEAVYLGDHGTVNEAEYEGLILALKMALERGVKRIRIHMDSKLVVEQSLGAWQIKQPHLQPYVDRARELAGRFELVEIKHIPREENVVADALVTELLDEQTGHARGGHVRRTLVCA